MELGLENCRLAMEYTKESLRNTYIICKDKKHGEKAIKFYKSFGFKSLITVDMKAGFAIIVEEIARQEKKIYFDVIGYLKYIPSDRKYIELPSKIRPKIRHKFPREMMVSDDNQRWNKRIVVAKVKTKWPVIALKINFDLEDEFIEYRSWKYAKEID